MLITKKMTGKDFINYVNEHKNSYIPIEYFQEKGYLIKDKFKPRVDYLEIIKEIIERE